MVVATMVPEEVEAAGLVAVEVIAMMGLEVEGGRVILIPRALLSMLHHPILATVFSKFCIQLLHQQR